MKRTFSFGGNSMGMGVSLKGGSRRERKVRKARSPAARPPVRRWGIRSKTQRETGGVAGFFVGAAPCVRPAFGGWKSGQRRKGKPVVLQGFRRGGPLWPPGFW